MEKFGFFPKRSFIAFCFFKREKGLPNFSKKPQLFLEKIYPKFLLQFSQITVFPILKTILSFSRLIFCEPGRASSINEFLRFGESGRQQSVRVRLMSFLIIFKFPTFSASLEIHALLPAGENAGRAAPTEAK